MNRNFGGDCKASWIEFVHTGIQHLQSKLGIYCHQFAYIDQLCLVDISSLKGKDDNLLVDQPMHTAFSSGLGGAAWTALTRADMAIYISKRYREEEQGRE